MRREEHTAECFDQSDRSYDVLIVGCGPVGATFANYLRLFGHTVAIFDRDPEVFFAPRAMGFDEETLRVLHDLGVLDRVIERKSIYRFGLDFVDENDRVLLGFRRMNNTTDSTFKGGHGGFPETNVVHQPHVEELLREDFTRTPGVDAFLGYEVLEVDDLFGDQASLRIKNLDDGTETTFTGSFVIGSDGGRSLVRSVIGADRIDLGFSEDWLVVDAIAKDPNFYDSIPDGAKFVCGKEVAAVVCKGVHGHIRFDALRLDGAPDFRDSDSTGDYTEQATELISRHYDPAQFDIIRQAPYTFYAGMPATWRKGRAFVAGDAAHQTPPFAGQGLNMGVRDAANLSFKLHLVLTGRASEALLDTYEAERKPQSIETVKGAVTNGNLIQTSNPLKTRLRNLIFFLARHSKLVGGLFMGRGLRKPPYSEGFIEESKGAGAPMIRAGVDSIDGVRQCLDDIIGINFALISTRLQSGPAVERFETELDGKVLVAGHDFDDSRQRVSCWLEAHDAEVVLVRPDRYVFATGTDGDALCAAMFDQLGTPGRACT